MSVHASAGDRKRPTRDQLIRDEYANRMLPLFQLLPEEAEQSSLWFFGAATWLSLCRAGTDLFTAMERMAAVDEPEVMSPEEVAVELAAMRAERRAANAS